MNNVVAIFALLCLISPAGQAQNTNSNFRPELLKEQLVAFNFINNTSITANTASDITYESSDKSVSEREKNDVIESIPTMQFKYAMLMNVDVETVTNTALFNFIDDWYGTPYRLGGTTKRGIDCSAFTGELLGSVFSFALPRTAHEQYKACEHIKKEDLMPGDLVFFNTRGGVSHVGVYLANNHFVHSCSSQGVMISSLDDAYFSRRFIGAGRVNQ